jgi:hypothetical protein
MAGISCPLLRKLSTPYNRSAVSKYTILIIVLYAAIQLVAYLLKEAAKKREQARRREAGERASMGTVAQPAPTTDSPGGMMDGGGRGTASRSTGLTIEPLPPPTPVRKGMPLEDLAARRKAQIDELRMRREARTMGTAGPTGGGTKGAGGVRARGLIVPPAGASAPPSDLGGRVTDPMWKDRLEKAKRREEQERQAQRERQQRAVQQRESQTRAVKRRRAESQARLAEESKPPSVEPSDAQVAGVSDQTNTTAKAVLAVLRNPAQLRQAFILRELIDPPLALRDHQR